MKNGKCPKCGSDDVRVKDKLGGQRGTLWYAPLSGAFIQAYVCVNCGYLEEYVEQAKLAQIAEKWPRVE